MGNFVHPSAIVDAGAELGDDNFIGPYCIVGPRVRMGSGNRLEAYVSIGTPAQHRDYFRKPAGPVRIGDQNNIREYATINGGSHGTTTLGSDCNLLIGAHIGHDAIVRDRCTLSNNATLSGHTIIGQGANLGLAVVVHQYLAVGAYAMIGMNATVTRHLPPFAVCWGSPCEPRKLNRAGLERSGIAGGDVVVFEEWLAKATREPDSQPVLAHAYNQFVVQYAADRKTCEAAQAGG
jgi:UDP-N-acetylglucosamine acyltransferase